MTDFNGAPIATGVAERFDHPFDYVHKIAVNPTNGHVYVACHRKVVAHQMAVQHFKQFLEVLSLLLQPEDKAMLLYHQQAKYILLLQVRPRILL